MEGSHLGGDLFYAHFDAILALCLTQISPVISCKRCGLGKEIVLLIFNRTAVKFICRQKVCLSGISEISLSDNPYESSRAEQILWGADGMSCWHLSTRAGENARFLGSDRVGVARTAEISD